eukprot:TRINITY_DN713_c2_g2_i1.p1 TRINITY_DN713_c2_g2~~TRINITY_DN713_c2_g2_i1.p1  ORF type:complete len:887 (+),score=203.64 TRINITY_DN713_c2_g2_i1:150-2810(+)
MAAPQSGSTTPPPVPHPPPGLWPGWPPAFAHPSGWPSGPPPWAAWPPMMIPPPYPIGGGPFPPMPPGALPGVISGAVPGAVPSPEGTPAAAAAAAAAVSSNPTAVAANPITVPVPVPVAAPTPTTQSPPLPSSTVAPQRQSPGGAATNTVATNSYAAPIAKGTISGGAQPGANMGLGQALEQSNGNNKKGKGKNSNRNSLNTSINIGSNGNKNALSGANAGAVAGLPVSQVGLPSGDAQQQQGLFNRTQPAAAAPAPGQPPSQVLSQPQTTPQVAQAQMFYAAMQPIPGAGPHHLVHAPVPAPAPGQFDQFQQAAGQVQQSQQQQQQQPQQQQQQQQSGGRGGTVGNKQPPDFRRSMMGTAIEDSSQASQQQTSSATAAAAVPSAQPPLPTQPHPLHHHHHHHHQHQHHHHHQHHQSAQPQASLQHIPGTVPPPPGAAFHGASSSLAFSQAVAQSAHAAVAAASGTVHQPENPSTHTSPVGSNSISSITQNGNQSTGANLLGSSVAVAATTTTTTTTTTTPAPVTGSRTGWGSAVPKTKAQLHAQAESAKKAKEMNENYDRIMSRPSQETLPSLKDKRNKNGANTNSAINGNTNNKYSKKSTTNGNNNPDQEKFCVRACPADKVDALEMWLRDFGEPAIYRHPEKDLMFIAYSSPDVTSKVLGLLSQSSEDIFGVKLSASPYFPPGDKRRPAAKSANRNNGGTTLGGFTNGGIQGQVPQFGIKQPTVTGTGSMSLNNSVGSMRQEPSAPSIVNGGLNPTLVQPDIPPQAISTNSAHQHVSRTPTKAQLVSEIAELEKRLGDQPRRLNNEPMSSISTYLQSLKRRVEDQQQAFQRQAGGTGGTGVSQYSLDLQQSAAHLVVPPSGMSYGATSHIGFSMPAFPTPTTE